VAVTRQKAIGSELAGLIVLLADLAVGTGIRGSVRAPTRHSWRALRIDESLA
jgi:hypothetical protein